MMKIFPWVIVAFFFFGGIAFVSFEPTREIGIGQIWIAVSLFVAVIYVIVGLGPGGSPMKSGGTLDLSRWTGKTGRTTDSVKAGEPAGSAQVDDVGANTAAKQLERLEGLHQKGDLSDAEYQTQRDRIISEAS